MVHFAELAWLSLPFLHQLTFEVMSAFSEAPSFNWFLLNQTRDYVKLVDALWTEVPDRPPISTARCCVWWGNLFITRGNWRCCVWWWNLFHKAVDNPISSSLTNPLWEPAVHLMIQFWRTSFFLVSRDSSLTIQQAHYYLFFGLTSDWRESWIPCGGLHFLWLLVRFDLLSEGEELTGNWEVTTKWVFEFAMWLNVLIPHEFNDRSSPRSWATCGLSVANLFPLHAAEFISSGGDSSESWSRF